jgi:glycerophosphoryl diester phosphodiesterase
MKTLAEFAKEDKKFIVAHRGSSGTAPENTISAIKEAVEAGAMMVEVDIQLTKDNHFVAYHDENFEKFGSKDIKVSDLDLSEIESFDVENLYTNSFEKIPRLSNIIQYLKDKAYLILEIKSNFNKESIELAEKIYHSIQRFNFKDFTLFASFDYNILKHLKAIDNSINIAAIKIPNQNTMPSVLKQHIPIGAFICSIDEINDELVADANASGIYIGAYSADNEEQFNKIMNLDIKAIVTNYPKLISDLMVKY